MNSLPVIAIKNILDQVSEADKAAYALTCKHNANLTFSDNFLWKKITLYSHGQLLSIIKRGWTFDEVTVFDAHPSIQRGILVDKCKSYTLWSTSMSITLKYIASRNIYKGPQSPINLRPAEHNGDETLQHFFQQRDHDCEMTRKAAKVFVRGDFVSEFSVIPLNTHLRATELLDSIALPNFPDVTLINISGWNKDERSRRVDDPALLGLAMSDCTPIVTSYDTMVCEPEGWYNDYVDQVNISAPITWRKLFIAYMQVKSGRNDENYEMLIKTKMSHKYSTIYMRFDHGS